MALDINVNLTGQQQVDQLVSSVGRLDATTTTLSKSFDNLSTSNATLSSSVAKISTSSATTLTQLLALQTEVASLSASVTQLVTSNSALAASFSAASQAAAVNTAATASNASTQMELQAALRGTAGALGGLWLSYGAVIPMMTAFATAASVKNIQELGASFEYLTTYSAALDNTGASLGEIRSKLLAMQGVAQTPEALAKGFLELEKAGYQSKDALDSMTTVSKYSAIAEQDLGHSVEQLVTILNAYKATSVDANGAALTLASTSDIVAAAAQGSVVSFQDMQTALKYTTALSTTAHLGLLDVSAALMVMGDAGFKGSMGATALRTSITKMMDPSDKFNQLLGKAGVEMNKFASGESVMSLKEMFAELNRIKGVVSSEEWAKIAKEGFGLRGEQVTAAITDLSKYDAALKDLGGSAGFVDRIFNQLAGTAKFAGIELKAAFDKSLIKAFDGADASGILNNLRDIVSDPSFADSLTMLSSLVYGVGKAISSVAAAAMKEFGTFSTIFNKLSDLVAMAEKYASKRDIIDQALNPTPEKTNILSDSFNATPFGAATEAAHLLFTGISKVYDLVKTSGPLIPPSVDEDTGKVITDVDKLNSALEGLDLQLKAVRAGDSGQWISTPPSELIDQITLLEAKKKELYSPAAMNVGDSWMGELNQQAKDLGGNLLLAEDVTIKSVNEMLDKGRTFSMGFWGDFTFQAEASFSSTKSKMQIFMDSMSEANKATAMKIDEYIDSIGKTREQRQLADIERKYTVEKEKLIAQESLRETFAKNHPDQSYDTTRVVKLGLSIDERKDQEIAALVHRQEKPIEDMANKLKQAEDSTNAYLEAAGNDSEARKMESLQKWYDVREKLISDGARKGFDTAKLAADSQEEYDRKKVVIEEAATTKVKSINDELNNALVVSGNETYDSKLAKITDYYDKESVKIQKSVSNDYEAEELKWLNFEVFARKKDDLDEATKTAATKREEKYQHDLRTLEADADKYGLGDKSNLQKFYDATDRSYADQVKMFKDIKDLDPAKLEAAAAAAAKLRDAIKYTSSEAAKLGDNPFLGFSRGIIDAQKDVYTLGLAFYDLGKSIKSSLGTFVTDALKSFKEIGDPKNLTAITSIQDAITSLNDQASQDIYDSLSTSVEKMQFLSNDYNKLLQGAMTGNQKALDKYLGNLKTYLAEAKKNMSPEDYAKLYTKTMNDLTKVNTTFAGDTKTIWDGIGTAWSKLMDSIYNSFMDILGKMIAQKMMSAVFGAGGDGGLVGGALGTAGATIGGWASTAGSTVGSWVSEAGTAVSTWWAGLADGGYVAANPHGGKIIGGSGIKDDVFLGFTDGGHTANYGMGGEFVVNKAATAANLPLLETMNRKNFTGGGAVSSDSNFASSLTQSAAKSFVKHYIQEAVMNYFAQSASLSAAAGTSSAAVGTATPAIMNAAADSGVAIGSTAATTTAGEVAAEGSLSSALGPLGWVAAAMMAMYAIQESDAAGGTSRGIMQAGYNNLQDVSSRNNVAQDSTMHMFNTQKGVSQIQDSYNPFAGISQMSIDNANKVLTTQVLTKQGGAESGSEAVTGSGYNMSYNINSGNAGAVGMWGDATGFLREMMGEVEKMGPTTDAATMASAKYIAQMKGIPTLADELFLAYQAQHAAMSSIIPVFVDLNKGYQITKNYASSLTGALSYQVDVIDQATGNWKELTGALDDNPSNAVAPEPVYGDANYQYQDAAQYAPGVVPNAPIDNPWGDGARANGGWIGKYKSGRINQGSGIRDDVYLGNHSGTNYFGMGGEFVVSKGPAAKHAAALEAINSDRVDSSPSASATQGSTTIPVVIQMGTEKIQEFVLRVADGAVAVRQRQPNTGKTRI